VFEYLRVPNEPGASRRTESACWIFNVQRSAEKQATLGLLVFLVKEDFANSMKTFEIAGVPRDEVQVPSF
jgi:hypothetical protein